MNQVHQWRHQRDDAGYLCRHEHRATGRPSEAVLRTRRLENLLEGWFGTRRAPSQRQAPSGLTTSSPHAESVGPTTGPETRRQPDCWHGSVKSRHTSRSGRPRIEALV
jgi:hypothetical protein